MILASWLVECRSNTTLWHPSGFTYPSVACTDLWEMAPGLTQRGGDSRSGTLSLLHLQTMGGPLGPVSTSRFKDNPKSVRVTVIRIIRGRENMSYWEAIGVI